MQETESLEDRPKKSLIGRTITGVYQGLIGFYIELDDDQTIYVSQGVVLSSEEATIQ